MGVTLCTPETYALKAGYRATVVSSPDVFSEVGITLAQAGNRIELLKVGVEAQLACQGSRSTVAERRALRKGNADHEQEE